MYAQKNAERVQYYVFVNIELFQSSSIHLHFIPEFHSGLIKFNHFVVINSFLSAPKYVRAQKNICIFANQEDNRTKTKEQRC